MEHKNKFNRVTNQRAIMINKLDIKKGDNFVALEKNNLFATKKKLTDKAFTLWLYLASQADTVGKDDWILSRSHYMTTTGECKNNYIRAVEELIHTGYLVEITPTQLYFYEEARPITAPVHKMQKINNCGIPIALIKAELKAIEDSKPKVNVADSIECTPTGDTRSNIKSVYPNDDIVCTQKECFECTPVEDCNSINEYYKINNINRFDVEEEIESLEYGYQP